MSAQNRARAMQQYREAMAWLDAIELPLSFDEWFAVMRDAPRHVRSLRELVRQLSTQVNASPDTLRELDSEPTPIPLIPKIEEPAEIDPIARVTTDLIQLIAKEIHKQGKGPKTSVTEYQHLKK